VALFYKFYWLKRFLASATHFSTSMENRNGNHNYPHHDSFDPHSACVALRFVGCGWQIVGPLEPTSMMEF
jgi:hypothetical protein